MSDYQPGRGKHARYDGPTEADPAGAYAPEPPTPRPGAQEPAYDDRTAARPVIRDEDYQDYPAEHTEPYADEHEYADPYEPEHVPGWEEPHRRSPWRSIMAAVIVVVVIAAIALGGAKGIGFLKDKLHPSAADYSGSTAHGKVVFQVHEGDTATDIGRDLQAAGVVESAGAFVDAAKGDPKSSGIQVGYYVLQDQMKASDALKILDDPKNLVQSVVTVPEGARVAQIVDLIAEHTKIAKQDVVAALAKPSSLGLPADADGDPEGYLFPATYTVIPGETATQLLSQMVAKAKTEYAQLGVAAGAAKLHLTSRQLITVASILEYEAKRTQDYPKVARAIYNRLARKMPLQSDATVSYANGVSGQIWTTASQRSNGSPYNTYTHTGLPPGPIGSPGEATIEAAMHPASGSWLYWVVVNLKTGKTVFSDTLAQHNQAIAQFKAYCRTSKAC